MEISGSAKDQNLLSVLREVTEQQTGQEKEATQFSTETPTDEYDDGETYGSQDVSLEKNEMNGCDCDVNKTVEGSDVNLQVRNGSEGENTTERANDVNVQGNDGKRDVAPAENEAKCDVSLEKNEMNGYDHDVNKTVESCGGNLLVRNGSEGENETERGNDVHVEGTDGEPADVSVSERSCSVSAAKEEEEKRDVCDKNDNDTQGVINIKPQDDGTVELQDIVDISGQYLVDATTNEVHNIDNIDISQFTQIYLVDHIQQNAGENAETKYTLTVVVEDTEEVKVKQEDENDTAAKPPEPVEDHDEMNSNVVAESGKVKDRDVIPSDPTPVEDRDIMHSDGVAQTTVAKDHDVNPSDPTPVEDRDVMHSDGVAEPTAVKDRDVIPSDPTLVEDHDVMHSGVAKHRVVKDSDVVAKPTPVDHDVMHSHVAMKPPAQVEKSDGIPSAESDIEVLCVKKGEEKCVPKDNTETSKSDTMMESDSYVTALKDNNVENHSDTTETESSSDGSKRNSCYKTKKTEGESNSDVILLNDASDTTEKEG